MLAELREDNQSLAARMREVYEVEDEHHDIGTASWSRAGKTNPNGPPGFCLNQAGAATRRATGEFAWPARSRHFAYKTGVEGTEEAYCGQSITHT